MKQINEKIMETKKQYALPVYNHDEIDSIPNREIQFMINDQLFLDTLLMEIRGKSISYASFKNKQRNCREKHLIKRIADLEENTEINSTEQIENLKAELYDIRYEKLKGQMIRSKAQYIDQGEKPTKYFCGLEKHNYVSKIIGQLEKDNGTILTEQQEILKETENFYRKLYENKDGKLEKNDIPVEQYRNDSNMTKLKNEEANTIEGLLTYKEISDILYNMKHDKSPGLSGFSAEFFKVFWRQLGIFVLRSLNLEYEIGELSITQRQGIITCIPKENKPKQFLKNWRPLTLLDTVYKIASGAIANRIKSVIDKLIDKDQTGFIKGRYIGENTRLVYDLMKHTEQKNISGLLLLIDFEKAFDSLSWSFIQKALTFLNFGYSLRRWIHTFYSNITSAIIQCGYLSAFFNISHGCRQGDPLSPYLFIICAEFLSNSIRKNKKIKGIFSNDTEFKVTQFADDTMIFLDGSKESLNSTLEESEKFAKISGLKINFDKTQLVWIGSKKYSSDTIKTKWKLAWGHHKFKLLGINFSVDLDSMVNENFTIKLQHLQNIAKQWAKRSLSPLGKITIIKTFMIAIFNHLFIMLPNPNNEIIQKINDILFDFLWNSKTSKLKQSTVIKQYCDGGLKMINLRAFIDALKSTWIRRLLTTDSKWLALITSQIKIDELTGNNMKYVDDRIKRITNQFWKDVLQSIISINKKTLVTEEYVLTSPIYYNKNIQIGRTHIYYKSWFDNGIKYVNDLINEHGEFYEQTEFMQKTRIQTNFLQYNGLIKSIKMYLKNINIQITHKQPCPFTPSHIYPMLQQKKGTQATYNILNRNKEIPTGQVTWNKLYTITNNDWKNIYLFPFNITKYPAMQWFQISINHNILVTNKLLYQMRIKNDSLCTFCQSNNETIIHLLLKCDKTQKFTREIARWLGTCNIQCNITEEYFIFGLQREHTFSKIFNFILLYAKYYICLARCKKQSLTLSVFQKKLKFMYKVHKEIAYSHKKEDEFQKDWSRYQTLINRIT